MYSVQKPNKIDMSNVSKLSIRKSASPITLRQSFVKPVNEETPFAPKSPTSPTDWSMIPTPVVTPHTVGFSPKSNVPYSEQAAMQQIGGYTPLKRIGQTLQGSIWKVECGDQKSVIKATNRRLHEQSVALVNNTEIGIQENVLQEAAILQYLTFNNPPNALAKFERFFCDQTNYFLVMEDGGSPLFDFVIKCHKLMAAKKLTVTEWRRFCKVAFQQMVELLHWMHTEMKCCHLDISLENFTIQNVMVAVNHKSGRLHFQPGFQIKMVDFGLAEIFQNGSFSCSKFVGKTKYKAPEVYNRCKFDARSADIWSLTVCLFMMLVGGAPYLTPTRSDATFGSLVQGKMMNILVSWHRVEYVPSAALDLMNRVFAAGPDRLNIDEIKKHPWLL